MLWKKWRELVIRRWRWHREGLFIICRGPTSRCADTKPLGCRPVCCFSSSLFVLFCALFTFSNEFFSLPFGYWVSSPGRGIYRRRWHGSESPARGFPQTVLTGGLVTSSHVITRGGGAQKNVKQISGMEENCDGKRVAWNLGAKGNIVTGAWRPPPRPGIGQTWSNTHHGCFCLIIIDVSNGVSEQQRKWGRVCLSWFFSFYFRNRTTTTTTKALTNISQVNNRTRSPLCRQESFCSPKLFIYKKRRKREDVCY